MFKPGIKFLFMLNQTGLEVVFGKSFSKYILIICKTGIFIINLSILRR